MSQSGALCFYQRKSPSDLDAMLESLFGAVGVSVARYASHTLGIDRRWQAFLTGEDDSPRIEHLPDGLGPTELLAAWDRRHRLTAEFGSCPLAVRVSEAVRQHIDESVRGAYLPVEPYVEVGEHDLIDWRSEGVLVARAFLSVEFCGYGTALDVVAFEQQVWQLPGIIDAKAKLEAALGPLEQCMLWSP